MTDVSLPRDARPSDRLEVTFRLECPEGHVRFATLGGPKLRQARDGLEIWLRCPGCRTSVRFDVVGPSDSSGGEEVDGS